MFKDLLFDSEKNIAHNITLRLRFEGHSPSIDIAFRPDLAGGGDAASLVPPGLSGEDAAVVVAGAGVVPGGRGAASNGGPPPPTVCGRRGTRCSPDAEEDLPLGGARDATMAPTVSNGGVLPDSDSLFDAPGALGHACDADPETCGCPGVHQSDYRGSINTTRSGQTCLRWDEKKLVQNIMQLWI